MKRFFLIIATLFIAACWPEETPNAKASVSFEKDTIRIVDREGRRVKADLTVEIADTDAKRMRGLMYRTELADNAGMLFLLPTNRKISMWMANTPLSLDMIFIDEQGEIQEIVEKTIPFSRDEIRSEKKAKSVLEIKGGFSKHYNLQPGDIVEHSFFKLEKAQ
ncbi:MAG: DUF192 domain-containing protein [Alphaproteobacteria bacterium]|nr:DUF192 domain-containing protein [Alphaproteobacteria bacterium]